MCVLNHSGIEKKVSIIHVSIMQLLYLTESTQPLSKEVSLTLVIDAEAMISRVM